MDPDENKARAALGDVNAVNDLESARSALRWAAGRLRALEKFQAECDTLAAEEKRRRLKAEEENRDLQAAAARQMARAERRAACLGKLDTLRLAERDRALQDESDRLARQRKEQRALWEKESELDRARLAEQARLRVLESERFLQEAFAARERAWEKERAALLKNADGWFSEKARYIEQLEGLRRRGQAQEAAAREELARESAKSGALAARVAEIESKSLDQRGQD